MLQAALRGHIARQRISKQLQKQDWIQVGDAEPADPAVLPSGRLGAAPRPRTATATDKPTVSKTGSGAKAGSGGKAGSGAKAGRGASSSGPLTRKDRTKWQLSDEETAAISLDSKGSPNPAAKKTAGTEKVRLISAPCTPAKCTKPQRTSSSPYLLPTRMLGRECMCVCVCVCVCMCSR